MELTFPISPLRLAVLISGGGTTLKNLLAKIGAGELDAQVVQVVSSHPQAHGLEYAQAAGVPTAVVERRGFPDVASFSEAVFDPVRSAEPHLVAMGGFLKLVQIPADFQNRVMNIHPSLIPAFCGHGFYGLHVHETVLDYGCKVSGCTVHFVDQQYDHGPIILQRSVDVSRDDTVETLAARVFAAECELYPEAIRLFAAGRLRVNGRRVQVNDQ